MTNRTIDITINYRKKIKGRKKGLIAVSLLFSEIRKLIEPCLEEKKSDNSAGGGNPVVSAISNNLITSGTKIEGNVTANSDMRIDGELYGNLICLGKIVMELKEKL